MVSQELVAGLIFVVTYALIATDRMDKTFGALAGGILMILLGVLDQEQAFEAIDFNVIFLLAGMMIIANVLGKTGVFQWVAVKSARLGRGDPFAILVIISVVTAFASALVDNVTTVVLIVPLTFFIASRLQISPVPFLIAAILSSNIGGTATLIGDPPNILVGSAAHLDFIAFLLNLAPVTIVVFAAFLVTCWLFFAKKLVVHDDLKAALMEIKDEDLITDKALLKKALAVLALTILGFLVHGALGLEPATIALAGASALMVVGKHNAHHILSEVEWATLFFFIGLFMVVGGVVRAGIIDAIAQAALDATQGNLALTSMLILWLSAILSALVDNIPYTTTMIPIVKELGNSMDAAPLWWSLALGACLGGNATIIGASANVIVANLAARSGFPISFGSYLKYGVIITVESMVISSVYIWIRYL